MGILKKHWLTAAMLIAVMFIVTACFQQVGDEGQGPAISLVVSETPSPQPSDTPTEETVIEATAADVGISMNSSDTPTPTETSTPTPTNTDVPTETSTPMSVAQVGDQNQLVGTATPDAFELEATQLIINATNTAVAPTTQAAATMFGQTDTPTPTAPATIDTTGLGQGGGVVVTGTDCVHEVRAGETLFRLSQYYGIPVNTIVSVNGVTNPNIISIGQRLTISGCGTTGARPLPTSTPTLTPTPFQLGSTVGTGGADLGQGGGATTGTTTGAIGGSCVQQYSVQQYDTLYRISVQFGVPVQSIANANGIVNPDRIDMFEVLCIPSS